MTRIVMADDPELIRALERSFVQRAGWEILTAASSDEAVARVRELRPELVVLDEGMPGFGGIEVARRLRQHPQTRRLPILLVADARPPDLDPNVGWVARPVSRDTLLEAITRRLRCAPRRTRRRRARLRVNYALGGQQGVAYSKDLCESGMFLRLHETLADGEELRLAFDVPGAESTLELAGRVVRQVRADPDSHLIAGVGLEFQSMSVGERAQLARFVRHEDGARA